MTELERDESIDWQAWEVDDLPDSFADDVLDRIDAGAARDDDVAIVTPSIEPTPRRRGWLVVATATVVTAAAAALLWWGMPPSPSAEADAPVTVSFDGVGVTAEDDAAAWRWLSTSQRSAIAEQTRGRVRWDAQRGVPLTVQTPAGRVSTNRADFTLEVLDMSLSATQLIAGTAMAGSVATLIHLHAGQAELSNGEGALSVEAPQRAAMSDETGPQVPSEPTAAPKLANGSAEWTAAKVGIQRALDARRASDDAGDDTATGTLSKEYIRKTVVEEALPLVKECYDNLLETDPDAVGRVVLQFAIMGDESVGGIVEEVGFSEDSELQDEDFRECVAQSMMSTVFDPPAGGGRVVIHYPFVFTNEDDTPQPADDGKPIPRVRQAEATVGPLDKDIIRRIVRAHIEEVRHCYSQGLAKNPDLAGRVAVQFTIATTGRVSEAGIASSTLDDENVNMCIVEAVKRWKFPKPDDVVAVTYPFVLDPG